MSFSIYMHTLFFSKKQISKKQVSLQFSSVTVHECKNKYKGEIHKPCTERASVLAFRREGILTVEAAVCIALFMFAALSLLSLFQTTEAFFKKQQILTQTARKISICSPAEDVTEFDVSYRFKPTFLILVNAAVPFHHKVYIKSWTGYKPAGGTEDGSGDKKVYYVTDFESVYHTSRECTHLRLSIQMVNKSMLGMSGSGQGSRYTPCEKCGGDANISGNYYVTEEGSRYHNSLSCPGLKRTIYEVTDVHGLSACSRCG